MANSVKRYFRRLAEGYEKGTIALILSPVLAIASFFYGSSTQILRGLYEKKWLPRKKLPFPVISVGNLTWGGTGKTPFVEYLARKAGEQHKTPLVLTRGYAHDEVEQLRHHLPRAVLGVGKRRASVAKELAQKHAIDVAILDDGLQHWPIQRDVEIVMINALNPFGNGKLLPQGILREPVSALKRAAIVAISHSNLISPKEMEPLKEVLKKNAPQAAILETYFEPLFFYRARKRARVSIERLQNQRVTTFSGVGAPRSFQQVLARLQIKPARNFEFTDHHIFSAKELEEIKRVSESAQVEEIVTTEKDFYRAPDLIAEVLNPLVLATRMRISLGEEILTDRLSRLWGTTSA